MAPTEENDVAEQTTISEIPSKPFAITMEFPLFLSMMAISLSGATMTNVLLYRTCVHQLNHTEEECKQFLLPGNHDLTPGLEQEVQKYTTYVTTVKLIIESIGPAVLSLFLGGWSDTHGRKPLVVWSIFGMCMSSMMTVVFTAMKHLGPWWYVATALPHSMMGGFTALFTGAFCYITDITSKGSRSFRLTLVEVSFAAGSVLGGAASSYLLRAVGAVYLLLLITSLYVVAYAFTNICLPESLPGAVKGGLSTLLDVLLVKDMLNTCFKQRPEHGRMKILNLTIANTMPIFILYGLLNLSYLYTRNKLDWSMRDYTIFNASDTTISMAGAFVGVLLVQRLCRVSDLPLSIVAMLSCITEYIIKAFAVKSWHMYLGASISMLKNVSSPLIKSHLTKSVPAEEMAQVFALMCAAEAILCPLLAPPTYNALYDCTISSFPGAVYLLSAALTAVSVLLLGYVTYYESRPAAAYRPLGEAAA